eukprot:36690-Prymnesium_polylepis.2
MHACGTGMGSGRSPPCAAHAKTRGGRTRIPNMRQTQRSGGLQPAGTPWDISSLSMCNRPHGPRPPQGGPHAGRVDLGPRVCVC